ncbi:type II toxin-antitoxin system HicB family antitoxin [Comamonas sp. CMM03]|nr:type II toxin-antitoxin system HicB family antitoxin [Comamonas sp. CMM03]
MGHNMLQKYPARFDPADEGGYNVSFRDIPEAITQGDDLAEAEAMARDALVTAMEFYFESGRPVPAPSKPAKGERIVELPPSVAAKVALLNARLASGARPADVARAMGIKPPEMSRIFDFTHATKIDTVAAALAAMGYELELSVRQVK